MGLHIFSASLESGKKRQRTVEIVSLLIELSTKEK